MKNNYKCCNIVVLIPLLCSFFFLGKMNANPFYYHFTCKPHLFVQQQITGTVKDQEGVPIPGVNVIVSGSSSGTITNLDGEYTIAARVGDTLVYSYIGFKAFKVQVTETFSGDIILQATIDALEEVVINAGYYNTTQRERTGNISRVTAEDLELQPVVSPLQALQGRMAGVEVSPSTGVAGAAPSFQIRGRNSLRNARGNNGNLPLYIIDGVPVNSSEIQSIGGMLTASGADPLSTLNTANIESIEVLKDADATAIYGSRGANGVVLITTKKGSYSQEKLQVEGQIYSGISQVPRFVDLMNTRQYIAMREESFANDNVTPTESKAYDLLLWDQDRYTNWQKEFMGNNAEITNANLNFSGGNQQTSFRIGGTFHDEGSVFPGDLDYQKLGANLAFNHRSKDQRLSLFLQANYGIEKRNLFDNTSFVSQALNLPPNAPEIYDEEGNLNWENSTWNNPLATLYRTNDARTNSLLTNFGFSYLIVKGLTLKANFGYSTLNAEEVTKNPVRSYDPEIQYRIVPTSRHQLTNRDSWVTEPQLHYEFSLEKHNFNIITGLTFQERTDKVVSMRGEGFSNENLLGNLAAADDVKVTTDREIIYKYAAVFGRIGYNWNNKYFINLTGRRDGSSRFGPDKRFANFGAIGAAWIFTEEQWIADHIPMLSFGKLRGSYGTTGSDQIPDYGYLDTYEPTRGPNGLYPTQLTNRDYSWEINKKLEIGTELSFVNGIYNLGVSYYRNRSTNQLVGYPLPSITGFTSVQANLPAVVQNTGWEFEMDIRPVTSKNFKWQLAANLTIPKNELLQFDNIDQTSYNQRFVVGQPLSIQRFYNYVGIDQETGLYQVEDVNGDGSYSFADQSVIVDFGRKFYGGINNTISFKNLSLQFLWEFINQKGYTSLAYVTTQPGEMGNKPVDHTNAWRQPGDQTNIQKNSQGINALLSDYYAKQSDLVVGDNSFWRLKTLSLSYKLPQGFINSLKMNQARIFIHGQNLWTFTDFEGLDPQTGNSLPQLRSLTAGLQFNF